MNIRRVILIILAALIFAGEASANNVKVENVSLYRAPGQPAGTIGVKFDLSWENSFTAIDNNGKTFFDRAWVFVKYFNTASQPDTAWSHATLISGGTVGDYNAVSGTGISADKKGAFCRQGANQVVYWNYGGAGGDDQPGAASFSVKVMAIEMVYVPQGAFYLGSGGIVSADSVEGEVGSFTDGSWTNGATIPFKVTSESQITMAPGAGKLWGTSATGESNIGPTGTLPAGFPKGYKGFYMMKYEATQGQYRDFLNTLNRAQQAARIATSIASNATSVTNKYVMADKDSVSSDSNGSYRNGIRCPSTFLPNIPITFYCDVTGDGVTATNGEFIACNWVGLADFAAFVDWAGLRPLTELEFEKACRGPMNPMAGEYPWATDQAGNATQYLVNPGEATETTLGYANNWNYYSLTMGNVNMCSINAPVRVGIYAGHANSTGKMTAGASYYGIMDLTGSMWEQVICVSNNSGRSFTGSHGDGNLNTTNSDWPVSPDNLGQRGGGFYNGFGCGRVSDRTNSATNNYNYRYRHRGIRCGRTADLEV